MSPHLFALGAAVVLGVVSLLLDEEHDPLKALVVGVLFYGVGWILATGARRLGKKDDS